ncbi:MAG: HD domain-containing protein [Nanoarchaeota archaeon]|nr:HD domain-containing protein [Nanoarchaeota archaeon]
MTMTIPTEEECMKLLNEYNPKLINHSVFMKDVALKIANIIERRGLQVNKDLLIAGALLHDIKKSSGDDKHNILGKEFVEEKGYPEVGGIIETHFFGTNPETTEEKIVFYADKRVNPGSVLVSVQKRMDYLVDMYNIEEEKVQPWLNQVQEIEKELFGENGERLL